MKAFVFLISFCLLAFLFSCNSPSEEVITSEEEVIDPATLLQGTWQGILVMNGEDTVWNVPEASMYKYFNGERFAFVHFDERDRSFSGTGGGVFTAGDNTFTEHLEYDSYDTTQVEKSFTFDYTLKGDTLTQIGIIETIDDSVYPIHEKYVRIEKYDTAQSPILGTWRYQLGRYGNETHLKRLSKDVDALSIFSPNHFFVVHFDPVHHRFIGITGGDYKLADSTYTEIIRYNSRDSTAVGTSFEFTYSKEDETFHKSGYMNSEKYPNLYIEEVFSKY